MNWRKKDEQPNFKPQIKTFKANKNGYAPNQGKSDSQPTRNRDIKCFMSLGTSHTTSQSLNKRMMILKDDGKNEIEIEGESNDKSIHLWRMQVMLNIQLMESFWFHEYLSMCKLKKIRKYNVKTSFTLNAMSIIRYSMIIDGGSCTNMVSTNLVEKLNLTTLKHLILYKLQ